MKLTRQHREKHNVFELIPRLGRIRVAHTLQAKHDARPLEDEEKFVHNDVFHSEA